MIGDGRETDDGLHARVVAGDRGGQADEVATGGVAEERDAVGVAFKLGGMRLHPANGGLHIFEAGRPAVLRGGAVVDGEPSELARAERCEPRGDVRAVAGWDAVLVAAAPTAAMHEDRHGKRASTLGHVGVEQEHFAGGASILDVALHVGERLTAEKRRELGHGATEFVGDERGEDGATRGVEVRGVGFALVKGVEFGGRGGAGVLAPLETAGVEIHERDVFFRGDFFHSLDVGRERGDQLAVGVEIAPAERSHEDGLGADGANLVHVAGHIGGVGRGGVSLAVGAFAGLVVVAELNQVVIASQGERGGPEVFIAIAL